MSFCSKLVDHDQHVNRQKLFVRKSIETFPKLSEQNLTCAQNLSTTVLSVSMVRSSPIDPTVNYFSGGSRGVEAEHEREGGGDPTNLHEVREMFALKHLCVSGLVLKWCLLCEAGTRLNEVLVDVCTDPLKCVKRATSFVQIGVTRKNVTRNTSVARALLVRKQF